MAAKKKGHKKTKTTKKAAGKTAKKKGKRGGKKAAKKHGGRSAKKRAGHSTSKKAGGSNAAPKAAPPAGVPSMLGGAPTSAIGLDDGEE
jgi:hypothetical protein